jgi:hypothetical protein
MRYLVGESIQCGIGQELKSALDGDTLRVALHLVFEPFRE